MFKIKKKQLNEVAIILPNFNSYNFIKETIKSVTSQTYKNWKLYIVDDASNQKTKNLLKSYEKNKKIKIFFLKKNKGAGFCRNLAIEKSHSKYIAFIDSDDIWARNKLKLQIKFMEQNDHNFTYTYYSTFNNFNKKVKKIKVPIKFNFKYFVGNTSIATSSMIVKRSIINNIIFLNSKICEDYYYKCQLLKKTTHAYCCPSYLLKYQIRKNSLQSNRIKNLYWVWKINKNLNRFTFLKNLTSVFLISINSIKKYGWR